MVTRALGQPPVDESRFVGRRVVEDQVNIQAGGHRGIDLVEEVAKLHRPVALLAGADHPAGGHFQRREKVGGAVTAIIVGAPFNLPQIKPNQTSQVKPNQTSQVKPVKSNKSSKTNQVCFAYAENKVQIVPKLKNRKLFQRWKNGR